MNTNSDFINTVSQYIPNYLPITSSTSSEAEVDTVLYFFCNSLWDGIRKSIVSGWLLSKRSGLKSS